MKLAGLQWKLQGTFRKIFDLTTKVSDGVAQLCFLSAVLNWQNATAVLHNGGHRETARRISETSGVIAETDKQIDKALARLGKANRTEDSILPLLLH